MTYSEDTGFDSEEQVDDELRRVVKVEDGEDHDSDERSGTCVSSTRTRTARVRGPFLVDTDNLFAI